MKIYPSFRAAREALTEQFRTQSYEVHPDTWQGSNVSARPEAKMRELLNISFQVSLGGKTDLSYWAKDTECNQLWADEHFAERVGGEPLNPPPSYKNWPWGHSAEKFLDPQGQFDHTYPERFWPKRAGYPLCSKVGRLNTADSDWNPLGGYRRGIRFEYGDYNDLVEHLRADLLSRQAYLPIWFPEDGTCKGRKPCTLGQHFIRRFGHLHTTYYIRSCDFYRHYNDDCYLAVRLVIDLLERLRKLDPANWNSVSLGMFTFHCVSLHLFQNDFRKLCAETVAKV